MATSISPRSESAIFFEGDIILEQTTPIDTSGGFADLFIGIHPSEGKVALKRLRSGHERQQRNFLKEASMWRNLSHPSILPFLGVLHHGGHLYLVSPFMDHGCLPNYLVLHPDADRCRLIYEIAEGLAYLHYHELIHGDVKGANVLISYELRATLCDFGLSKVVDTTTNSSMAGVGSMRWQAPELFDESPKSSKTTRSDVYAFGLTIAEVLSGKLPFHEIEGSGPLVLAIFYDNKRPPTTPTCSRTGESYQRLWEVAGRCWKKVPEARPVMDQVADILRPWYGTGNGAGGDDAIAPSKRLSEQIQHEHAGEDGWEDDGVEGDAEGLRLLALAQDALDIDGAILRKEKVLVMCPQGHAYHAGALRGLAESLYERFKRDRRSSDLDRVIDLKERVLFLRSEGQTSRTSALSSLADSLHERFEPGKDPSDLDRAVELKERALQRHPRDHTGRPGALRSLALSLRKRYSSYGDPSDLDRAVQLDEQLLVLRPKNHPDRAEALRTLASSLHTRASHFGGRPDMELAIQLETEVLDLRPEGHAERADALRELAISLHERFKQNGVGPDMTRAIALKRMVLELRPEGHVGRADALHELAVSLLDRYIHGTHGGSRSDIDQAIDYEEGVLELRHKSHPQHVETLRSLAVCLHERFFENGDPNDISKAIELKEEVLKMCPEEHIDHAEALRELAASLHERFRHNGDLKDVIRAVELKEQVLLVHSEGHTEHGAALRDLAVTLKAWGHHSLRTQSGEIPPP